MITSAGRPARHLLRAVVLLILTAAGAALDRAQTTEPARATEQKEVDIIWGMKIPMHDGMRLNATVCKPAGMKDPLPVIFTLTPYISDSYHERAMYFARNGYVYALVDVRGRGNSEGRYEPFANDAHDGYDVVEWLAAQPWSNGKVAMWGGSYAGYDQWTTAKELPPHLATIVPAAAAHPGVDFPFQDNIFYSYDIQWITLTSGVTPNNHLFGESSYWLAKFRDLYLNHLPFRQLDHIAGNPSPIFQKWLDHPTPDAYLNAMVPSPEQYAKLRIPILTITGHYDADQRGALTFYRRHMQYGAPEATAQHYLIIGPWDHAGTRTPRAEVGGLKFGPASLLDLNKLHKEWYDWTMKGGPKPEFLKKRVAYYVSGLEQWKYADRVEDIAKGSVKLYLDSDGHANDVFHSGSFVDEKPGAEPPDRYVYDPLDVRPAELEREEIANYLTDQRAALNLFGNGVVFNSMPFKEDTEVTGYLKFTVWISLDVPDTDFQVAVYEILPDGTSIFLTDAMLRARYRDSLTEGKPVKPGVIERYEFTDFQYFSRRIGKGSRLRLVLRSPNSTQLEKNYNSGGVVAEESGKDARTAHVTVYHDAEHPSRLELPVVF